MARFGSYWHPPHAATDDLCLVVAAQSERREILHRVAATSGWTVIEHAGAASALAQCNRLIIRLAIIDVQGLTCPELQPFRELLEQLGGLNGLLIVVWGDEGNHDQECWAWHFGLFMYLTGTLHEDELSGYLFQAREIASAERRDSVPL